MATPTGTAGAAPGRAWRRAAPRGPSTPAAPARRAERARRAASAAPHGFAASVGRVHQRLEPLDHALPVVGGHPRQHALDAAHLHGRAAPAPAPCPGGVSSSTYTRRSAGSSPRSDELLLLEAVDDVRDRGQRDAERLGHVAHVAAGVVGDVEEDLRLRVGEVELRGALPQELAERGAAERVQEVEEPLGLRGPRARGRRGLHGGLNGVPD